MRPICEEFVINVRNIRKQKGFSQEFLASECGLDRTTIVSIENGKANPTLLNIATIAEVLGVKPHVLLLVD